MMFILLMDMQTDKINHNTKKCTITDLAKSIFKESVDVMSDI